MLSTLVLSLFLASALASTSLTERTGTRVRCSTSYSHIPLGGAIPTSTSTTTNHKLPVWIYSTSTPVVQQQPPPVTKTRIAYAVTTTTITDLAVTDVFSSTTIIISTATNLQTSTTTILSTSFTTSTSTATSIIPTTLGFLPIQSTVPSAYPRKRSLPRQALPPPQKQAKGLATSLIRSPGTHPKYEQRVACKQNVNVHTTGYVTFTAPTTVSQLPAQTQWVKSTSTFTSTSTVIPADVLTTSTFSTTVWFTTTATTTTSTTSTTTSTIEAVFTATSLAACAADNFIGPTFLGHTMNSFGQQPGSPVLQTFYVQANTPYDCCALCITTPGCAYAAAIYDNYCSLQVTSNQFCQGQSLNPGFYDASSSALLGFTFSNGNCGYMYFGG